jgi:hypothetical protein
LEPAASAADRPDGRVSYVVSLPPFGSVFVLDAETPSRRSEGERSVATKPLDGTWTVSLPGCLETSVSPQPRLWTDLDDRARAFSGIGSYRLEIELESAQLDAHRVQLDLGEVHDIARVTVNGVECGIAWTAPFRVDVTPAIAPGRNVLEIEVATPWRNRLIAEAIEPSGDVLDPMTRVFETTASPLAAGLAGPISLVAHGGRSA